MFQLFQTYVSSVSSKCCYVYARMFQTYVSDVFILILQVFHLDVAKVDLDVAYVAMAIHACVEGHVSSVLSVFRRMLQVFYLDVVYDANGYVASICCECFICFRCMLQLFHLSIIKVNLDVGVEKA